MIASQGTTPLPGRPTSTVSVRTAATSSRPFPSGFLPWAAFHLLCFWTRSTPEAVGRMLGADGFDAGFGLGEGKR